MTKPSAKPTGEASLKPMGRYRKVEVRTWGDEKFRSLTPIPPCGAGLWLYLITGPHTGPIPGLFRAGRAGMAEELGWELEAFDEAFREVLSQGMVKADLKARVMWIPNAIRCNRPESPNVVISWATEFELIPECDLKAEAYESLRDALVQLGPSYVEAFDLRIPKPGRKPSAKPLPKAMANQEQEQEQQQEAGAGAGKGEGAATPADLPPPAPPAGPAPAAPVPPKAAATPADPPAPTPAPAAERGQRKCPSGFVVTQAMREWAATETPLADITTETATMKDHTFKVSVLDWPGAWRNWMRKAQKFAEGQRGRQQQRGPVDADTQRQASLDKAERIRIAMAAGGGAVLPAAPLNPPIPQAEVVDA